MGQYIPDLTERFPEGFDGVDMTDSYFTPTKVNADEYIYFNDLEREYREEQEAE